jgi:hypothetical protein
MFEVDEIVLTPHGKAIIKIVNKKEKTVRVEHLEAKTPITDYYFSEIKFYLRK